MESADEREQPGGPVGRLFDALADDYDQSGVSFFAPIAEGLVETLDLRPGERVVDIGCGRGAVTFPAARAVGEHGTVTAVDISTAMVELTRRGAEEAGLSQVRTAVVGPDLAELADASADAAAASLVLFFAPDPSESLRRWMRLLVPGGRLGLSTFGVADPIWEQVDNLFDPYLPAHLLDARTTGEAGPFASDEGMEDLCRSCGATDVRTVHTRLPVRFADAAQWRAFTMGTGQRAFWGFVPADRREALHAEAAGLLEGARDETGDIVLVQDVRYTLAVV
jgi:ubiquinone/menaquinone biosynthesis C-methylase UbiE